MNPPPSRPWDRLPEESASAYEAFQLYLKLGHSRTVLAAQEAIRRHRDGTPGVRQGTAKSGAMGRWSAGLRWTERAAAWDRHVAEVEARAFAEAAERQATAEAERWAARISHWEEANWEAFDFAARRLDKLAKQEDDPKQMPASPAAVAAALAAFNAARQGAREALAAHVNVAPATGQSAPPPDEAAAAVRAALEVKRAKALEAERLKASENQP